MIPPFAAALIVLLAILPTSGRAGELDADFVILRKGNPIGFHRVDVEATPEGRIARTTIAMRVNFGPLPLFRYDHQSVEEWRDGKLHSIEAQTKQNGERSFMRAFRKEGALFVEGSGYTGVAPATASPSTYWNRQIVKSEALLSTQTGELIPVAVSALGVSRSPGDVPAEQFRLVGTVPLNLWYEGERWIGSRFLIDGEELVYAPRTPRASAAITVSTAAN